MSNPARQQLHECFKLAEVLDIQHLAHILLHIGREVIAVKVLRIKRCVVKTRHEAGIEVLISLQCNAGGSHLGNGERQQLQNTGTPGQRLRNSGPQSRLMAAGQDILPIAFVFIHCGLNEAQQLRDALDFIEDDRRCVALQKSPGVGLGHLPDIEILQTDVPVLRERHLCKGSLAGLPGAGNRDHRIHGGQLEQLLLYFTQNHRTSPR